ncbi:hypothetical protein [Acetobacter senegalensis]|nr:hypothetical protein [Acetobacter senegalensis]
MADPQVGRRHTVIRAPVRVTVEGQCPAMAVIGYADIAAKSST